MSGLNWNKNRFSLNPSIQSGRAQMELEYPNYEHVMTKKWIHKYKNSNEFM